MSYKWRIVITNLKQCTYYFIGKNDSEQSSVFLFVVKFENGYTIKYVILNKNSKENFRNGNKQNVRDVQKNNAKIR